MVYKYLLENIKRNVREMVFGPFGHPEFIINKEKKYAYLVNSKAACTSIKGSVIDDLGYGLKNGQNPHHFDFLNNERCFRSIDLSEYFVFTVVREPVKRIASLYANKFRQYEVMEKQGFYYQGYMGGVFSVSDSFDRFVDCVCDISDYYADRHFVSQSYLISKAEKMCNTNISVFKMEEFEFFNENIFEKVGLKISDVKLNSSKTKVNPPEVDQTSLVKLAKRYRMDFDRLGY
tara:strand:- start:3390 stop:4088 length:699 start_codon:yes stop_codon:yes gene_type:complete